MKLHFPWDEVAQLVQEINTAKTARTLYGEVTGKGLWLVGDQGVYLMPNTTDGIHHSKRGPKDKLLVAYAKECNPDKMEFDEWWDAKQHSFGGDDGTEFLKVEEILAMVVEGSTDTLQPHYLVIDITPEQFEVSVAFKSSKKRAQIHS